MFIRPLSDIHNEFSMLNLPVLETDAKTILLLSGDIAVADRVESTLTPFLEANADRFSDVLYIPGNHEYYHGSLMTVDAKLRAVCNRFTNVHFMQKRSMVIDSVVYIGATLWTDFNSGNPMAMLHARSEMNDYRIIRTGSEVDAYRRKAMPIDTLGINKDHRDFIESELAKAAHAGMRAVVFTHHTPSMLSNCGLYPAGPLDYAYHNTGLEEMIHTYEPVLWFHGHTHHPMDYMLGNTRVICNPRGYTRDPNGNEGLGFNDSLVVEPLIHCASSELYRG